MVNIIFNYLWGAILPFIIAYILAECFRPIVRYSERNERFPKRFFVLMVVVIAAGSLAGLIFAITRQLIREIAELSAVIKNTITLMQADEQYARDMIELINSMVPFIDLTERLWAMRSNLNQELLGLIGSVAESVSGNLISFVGNVASFLPNAVFSAVVAIISTYYIAVDRVKINCFFLSLFPKKIRPKLKRAKEIVANTVLKYLHAYGLLFGITFAELLITFSVLRTEYSFFLALLVAIVDILPLLGAGAVLIPWGVISLVSGDYRSGTVLLVGYAVITLVRQIIEPKIVGKFIGLSPLAALASMYIGLKTVGIIGVFAFLMAAMILKRILINANEKSSTVK